MLRKVNTTGFLAVILLFVLACPVIAAQYTYDALNRLITVTYENGQMVEYSYDAAGNMLSEKITAATAITVTPLDDHVGMGPDNKSISNLDASWTLSISDGTVKDDISPDDLTVENLPDGLNMAVSKGDTDNIILITISGSADPAISSQQTISVTVKATALNETGLNDASPVNVYIWPYESETPGTIELTPNTLQEGYPDTELTVSGTATNFSAGTTTLLIKDKDGNDVTGQSTLSVTSADSATITLKSGLTRVGSPYIVTLTTDAKVLRVQLFIENTDQCFIATAAFGSTLEPAVVLLRQFRDKCLLTNIPGQEFVNFYYQHSPPIAAYITQHEPLKLLVRILLMPLIAIAYTMLHPVLLALLGCIIILLVVYRKRLRAEL